MKDEGLKVRLAHEGLEARARSPELWAKIEALKKSRGSAAEIEDLLDRALAMPTSLAGTVQASAEARKTLDPHLDEGTRRRLDAVEAQVLAGHTGPSLLKGMLYRAAKEHRCRELLKATWFEELFDRLESRRFTDHDAASA